MSMTARQTRTEPTATPSSAEVWAIPTRHVPQVWPLCEGMIEKAVDYANGRVTTRGIYDRLLDRDLQLWCVIRDDEILAACITKVSRFPAVKSCCIMYAGGTELDSWMSRILDTVETWAKELECDVLEVNGRRGWVRKLKDQGFREISVTVEKRL